MHCSLSTRIFEIVERVRLAIRASEVPFVRKNRGDSPDAFTRPDP